MFVIGNKLCSFERRKFALPTGDFCVERGEIRVTIFREIRRVFGRDGDERGANILHGNFRQHGVEQIMRIAVRMHVTFGVVGGFRHVHGRHAFGAIHIARPSRLDARITARLQQRGQKGVFTIEADEHDEIGAVEQRHKARPHRHAVRVFDAGRKTADVHEIAADIAREIREVSERGDDVDFSGEGLRCAERQD